MIGANVLDRVGKPDISVHDADLAAHVRLISRIGLRPCVLFLTLIFFQVVNFELRSRSSAVVILGAGCVPGTCALGVVFLSLFCGNWDSYVCLSTNRILLTFWLPVRCQRNPRQATGPHGRSSSSAATPTTNLGSSSLSAISAFGGRKKASMHDITTNTAVDGRATTAKDRNARSGGGGRLSKHAKQQAKKSNKAAPPQVGVSAGGCSLPAKGEQRQAQAGAAVGGKPCTAATAAAGRRKKEPAKGAAAELNKEAAAKEAAENTKRRELAKEAAKAAHQRCVQEQFAKIKIADAKAAEDLQRESGESSSSSSSTAAAVGGRYAAFSFINDVVLVRFEICAARMHAFRVKVLQVGCSLFSFCWWSRFL